MGYVRYAASRAKVQVIIERLAAGNPVGEGVPELRIDYGPGYRVYFKKIGSEVINLLEGGDKRTQPPDITTALRPFTVSDRCGQFGGSCCTRVDRLPVRRYSSRQMTERRPGAPC